MFGLDPITAFVLFSASLTVILQLLKKIFPEMQKNEIVKKRLMPIIPSIIGMGCAVFLVPRFSESASLEVSLFIGFMAGAMSTSCYEMGKVIAETFVKEKVKKVESDE